MSMSTRCLSWRCSVCGGGRAKPRFNVGNAVGEDGVSPAAFRPSSTGFGRPLGRVLSCEACGHSMLAEFPSPEKVSVAYAEAADEVSVREERGQVATADRALVRLEEVVTPGRLLDVGCWTGSFLDAARHRGWDPIGVEPARWACERANERGLTVLRGHLGEMELPALASSFRAVVACDVLEHLADPGAAVAAMFEMLEPGGVLFVTVPDAGSRLARVLGARWWSVLPMHLQYFSRGSMSRLLTGSGFVVHDIRTHVKVFSARYYAERLGGYSGIARWAVLRALSKAGVSERLIAPDFRDRMAVIAIKPPVATHGPN